MESTAKRTEHIENDCGGEQHRSVNSSTVYLALGSNLGDREANLRAALKSLKTGGVAITKESARYETAPQYVADQPWFLNMVAEGTTKLSAVEALRVANDVERQLGRDRSQVVAKGPRSIDIDILLFGDEVIHTPELTVPHEGILERRFVLEPLIEIAPDLVDPRTGVPLRNYLPAVRDQFVNKLAS